MCQPPIWRESRQLFPSVFLRLLSFLLLPRKRCTLCQLDNTNACFIPNTCLRTSGSASTLPAGRCCCISEVRAQGDPDRQIRLSYLGKAGIQRFCCRRHAHPFRTSLLSARTPLTSLVVALLALGIRSLAHRRSHTTDTTRCLRQRSSSTTSRMTCSGTSGTRRSLWRSVTR